MKKRWPVYFISGELQSGHNDFDKVSKVVKDLYKFYDEWLLTHDPKNAV